MVLTYTFHLDNNPSTVLARIVSPAVDVLGAGVLLGGRGLDKAFRPFKVTMLAHLHLRLA